MLLRIIDDQQQWEIECRIEDLTRDALRLQTLRDPTSREQMLLRLAAQLPDLLLHTLDIGLHPPTEDQIADALEIAAVLRVSIPGDAIRYREHMDTFIAQHGAHCDLRRYRERKHQHQQGSRSEDFDWK